MNKRVASFAVVVVLTLAAFVVVWEITLRSMIPVAVAAATERGARLPAYQIVGVDLASIRFGWLVWAAIAVLVYWRYAQKKMSNTSSALPIFGAYVTPLIVTSGLLIVPLAL